MPTAVRAVHTLCFWLDFRVFLLFIYHAKRGLKIELFLSGTLLFFCISIFAFGVLFCSSVFSFPAQAGPQNSCSSLVKTCVALLEACLRKNKVPEISNFIAQRCAPVCLRKIQFRKKYLYSPTLCARVSRENKVPQKNFIRQLCAPVCQEIQFPEKKNFTRQRCAPVCLRKTKFRKKGLYSPTLRARVSRESKVQENKNLFANAVCPCVSGK